MNAVQDGQRCEVAGAGNLTAHHLRPLRMQPSYDPRQGVALCLPHHREAERRLAMLHDAPLAWLLAKWPEVVDELEHLDKITWCVEPEEAKDRLREAIAADFAAVRDELLHRETLTLASARVNCLICLVPRCPPLADERTTIPPKNGDVLRRTSSVDDPFYDDKPLVRNDEAMAGACPTRGKQGCRSVQPTLPVRRPSSHGLQTGPTPALLRPGASSGRRRRPCSARRAGPRHAFV